MCTKNNQYWRFNIKKAIEMCKAVMILKNVK